MIFFYCFFSKCFFILQVLNFLVIVLYVFKFLIISKIVNHTLVISMTLLLTALSIAGTISLNVMAKDNAVGLYRCFPQDGGETVLCCQLFQGSGDSKWFCTYCDNTSPPSNCLPRFEARNEGGGDIFASPQEGISDDHQAGDNPNPGIPPTEGVTDETESENSESEAENTDSGNTIPRKGDSGLDSSKLNENENVIVQ